MAKKKIKAYLSINGINKVQSLLSNYQNDIKTKTETFIRKLTELGEVTAYNHIDSVDLFDVGELSTLIKVEKRFDRPINGYKGVVLAFDVSKVVSVWYNSQGEQRAEVSPILMAEFGSGQYAENPLNVSGVGQGTFPNQKHAFDPQGWYWIDEKGKDHHSRGITPTQPMYHAQQEILKSINYYAKEVFR